jgi:hypothetical protein
MQTAMGYITVVQEQRFRLLTNEGQGLLLTLAHHASLRGSYLRLDGQPAAAHHGEIPGSLFVRVHRGRHGA